MWNLIYYVYVIESLKVLEIELLAKKCQVLSIMPELNTLLLSHGKSM